MNRNQIIDIFKILRTTYPRFYANITKQEAEDTIDLWLEMFKHENPELVIMAVKHLINTFKFPPTIADVKEAMYKLTKTEEETPAELWNTIRKAIQRSSYYAAEEFEKLPELAKKYVGSPDQLREWAIDMEYNDAVARGQFFKQIEVIKQREKEDSLMLPETKEMLKALTSKMAIGDKKLLS